MSNKKILAKKLLMFFYGFLIYIKKSLLVNIKHKNCKYVKIYTKKSSYYLNKKSIIFI